MLDFSSRAGLGKRHIEGNPRNDRLPSFIFGQPMPLDRAPQTDDLFLRNRFKEVLVTVEISIYFGDLSHNLASAL